MTDDLHTIERLRPRPEPLDTEWSTSVLSNILAQPTTVKRRRGPRLAAGTAALVLATAGSAYAAGLVPEFVTNGFGDVSTDDVTSQRLVADLTVPDGRRVGIWTAVDGAGDRCRAIADDWDGRNASSASSFECGSNFPRVDYLWTSAGYPIGQTPPPAYLIVFGQRPDPSAVSVRITVNDIDFSTPVDSTSGGFAANVPLPPRPYGAGGTPVLNLDFLNASGAVVSTRILRDN